MLFHVFKNIIQMDFRKLRSAAPQGQTPCSVMKGGGGPEKAED